MKHLSITLLLFFYSLLSWAQTPVNEDSLRVAWKADKKLDQERVQWEITEQNRKLKGSTALINKADFVFEGEGLSIRQEPINEFHTTIYVLVRVGRVFRGDTTWQGKTLEVAFVDYGKNAHYLFAQSIGLGHSILFCQPMDLLPNPKPFQQELHVSMALLSNIGFSYDQDDDRAGGLSGVSFDSRREFYQYLGTHANINSTKITQSIAASKPIPGASARQAISSTKPITYQQWLAHWDKKVKQESKKKSTTNASLSATSSTNAITFSFANQTVTEAGGKQYFEVDIMTAASQTGKFFHNALSIYSRQS